jgi:hypothetical protein
MTTSRSMVGCRRVCDDARAVVDGNGTSQRRTRVDVDAGDAVRGLTDEPRQERDAPRPQGVREPVTGESVKPRVGEDDLVDTGRGRVGVERCLRVHREGVVDGREFIQEPPRRECVVVFDTSQELAERLVQPVDFRAHAGAIASPVRREVRKEQGQRVCDECAGQFVRANRQPVAVARRANRANPGVDAGGRGSHVLLDAGWTSLAPGCALRGSRPVRARILEAAGAER